MKPTIERRRTIRLRRSALLKQGIESIDKPAIKIAENDDEFRQAFGVLHQAYSQLGYVPPNPAGLYCTPYHLLEESRVLVFKSYLQVISTLSRFQDHPELGLPMDSLYKQELDELRDAGCTLVEVGAFASPADQRWSNAMFFLQRSVILMSVFQGFTDMCITVNPKHVKYYMEILLFEQFGEVKSYPGFDAPAVPLRLRLNSFPEDLHRAYEDADFETNLYDFFYARESELQRLQNNQLYDLDIGFTPPPELVRDLAQAMPGLASSMPPQKRDILLQRYPDAGL